MLIKGVLLRHQINDIKKALYAAQKDEAKHVGKRFAAMLESHLALTLRYWNDSNENKFPLPRFLHWIKIKGSPDSGVSELSVRVLMADNNGNPHFLWHILDAGRRTYTFPVGKRSPVLKRRKRRRTEKNNLRAKPFTGFTGEKFVIHGGQVVKGVDPNNWYRSAADEVIAKAKNDPQLKLWIPTVKITPMGKGS